MMISRRLTILFLVMFLTRAAGVPVVYAQTGAGEPPRGRSRLFWGALAAVNSAILASSISDMMLYDSRADNAQANGEEFQHLWQASSREKIVIGISAASLLVSLAGLKMAFQNRVPVHVPSVDPFQQIEREMLDTELEPEEETFQVISLEGRVRYDTLFAAVAVPESVTVTEEYGVLPLHSPVDTTAKVIENDRAPLSEENPTLVTEILKEDPVDMAFLDILSSGEDSLSESAPIPAAGDWDGEPVEDDHAFLMENSEPIAPPTFSLLPYGVHVSSFRTIERTETEEEMWAKRGEIVIIEETEIAGEGTWYRVILGNFENYDEANLHATRLQTEWNLEYSQVRKH